jgi:hypothetical protein
MTDLRPIGGERDGAAQLLASAHARVSAAAAEISLPDALRLSDWQRTAARSLLARLVRSIEEELRAALAADASDEALHAAFSSAHVEIALPVMEERRALSEPALVEMVLRRVEEHRIHRAAGADHALLIDLSGHGDEALASEAMGLLVAQSARLDAFQDPFLPRSDLPAELEHHLVWTVAAALRRYMVERHGAEAAAADEAASAAAAALLSRYDEGDTLDARCMRLARALREAGRLDDTIVRRSLTEGSLPLFVAVMALRTGLDHASVWELLSARSGWGAALLLRAAGVGREAAGAALFALASDEAAVPAQLDAYDATSPSEARRLLSLWRADPGYRAAVARLTP